MRSEEIIGHVLTWPRAFPNGAYRDARTWVLGTCMCVRMTMTVCVCIRLCVLVCVCGGGGYYNTLKDVHPLPPPKPPFPPDMGSWNPNDILQNSKTKIYERLLRRVLTKPHNPAIVFAQACGSVYAVYSWVLARIHKPTIENHFVGAGIATAVIILHTAPLYCWFRCQRL